MCSNLLVWQFLLSWLCPSLSSVGSGYGGCHSGLCRGICGLQGGIITRILASRMQQSLEPWAKFSVEVMKNHANSTKQKHHTRLFWRRICSESLGCGEVKNFMPPWWSLPSFSSFCKFCSLGLFWSSNKGCHDSGPLVSLCRYGSRRCRSCWGNSLFVPRHSRAQRSVLPKEVRWENLP